MSNTDEAGATGLKAFQNFESRPKDLSHFKQQGDSSTKADQICVWAHSTLQLQANNSVSAGNWSTLLTEVPPLPHPSPAHSPAIPCVRVSFSVKVSTLIYSPHTPKSSYVQALGSRSIRRKNANVQKVRGARPVLPSTRGERNGWIFFPLHIGASVLRPTPTICNRFQFGHKRLSASRAPAELTTIKSKNKENLSHEDLWPVPNDGAVPVHCGQRGWGRMNQ